jgi:putative lipoprotein
MTDTLPPLVGTEWSLVELDGKPAPLGAGDKPATLSLTTSDNRASGFSGCNRWAGSYERTGDQLRFGQMLSTKMACVSGMELEQQFLSALERVRSYAITPTGLELKSDSVVLARLVRR